MKSAAKLLRGNAITAGVTVVVLSSLDIANIFRGRILEEQLFKNMAGTVLGHFIEEDADEMVKIIENIFTSLAIDYLLSKKETRKREKLFLPREVQMIKGINLNIAYHSLLLTCISIWKYIYNKLFML